ncbi:KIN17-like protein isoform X2 [Prunus dulcis]|uniref:KIN17-like protein isoform X2 n=1 Tax=Prunus dulcis TaxID=3755 RepID=UPI0014837D28|nr:KIN17-like protein isoform X2 [Prunus dulcis]
MGKNDFLTPKAIANRIKAKGLQKLRWYCQMCQKQCRDENGFKCHCMSESHQRQMQIFGENSNRIVDGYSEEFEQSFLDFMKRSHRFSRIAATVVYNEYINDRHHVHMNSTEWATITEFVKHLGRTDQSEFGSTPHCPSLKIIEQRKSNDAEVESLREEYHQRVATLERKVYALTKERDTLRREQNKKSDAAALLKEKDEIINQVMAEGEELSKKQAAQEGQIRKLRAQIREFEEEKKGLITKLQDGKTLDNELEVVEGMKLDRGYISPYFITNQNNQKCELENPLIIIHEKKISSINDVVKVLELVLQICR